MFFPLFKRKHRLPQIINKQAKKHGDKQARYDFEGEFRSPNRRRDGLMQVGNLCSAKDQQDIDSVTSDHIGRCAAGSHQNIVSPRVTPQDVMGQAGHFLALPSDSRKASSHRAMKSRLQQATLRAEIGFA